MYSTNNYTCGNPITVNIIIVINGGGGGSEGWTRWSLMVPSNSNHSDSIFCNTTKSVVYIVYCNIDFSWLQCFLLLYSKFNCKGPYVVFVLYSIETKLCNKISRLLSLFSFTVIL